VPRRHTTLRTKRGMLALALVSSATVLAACTGTSSAPPSNTPSASTPAPASTSPPAPSTTVAPAAALSVYYAQRPAWRGCGSGFQCASILVPLDYARPAAGTISLNLIKLPATDPAHRVGSLLINPGGPGASGIAFARDAVQSFTPRVRAAYDIVGFDPRGIGSSSPLVCLTNRQQDAFIAANQNPTTPGQELALLALVQGFARSCQQHSARILPFMSTADQARDMDVIRAVVGDTKLHYYGASYGTFLGATYAELFPSRVGRLVLDGAIDPTLSAEALTAGQLRGFEVALSAFLQDCFHQSSCPVGPSETDARNQIGRLVQQSASHPLSSSSGRSVTQSLVILGLLSPLYNKQYGWPDLRDALSGALNGDGTGLLQLADLYSDRNSDGTYASNQNEAIYAVSCLDRPDHSTLAQLRADAVALAKVSPLFGPYFAWGNIPCTVWPIQPKVSLAPIRAVGAAPILVVGTTRDPATPYQWAVNLAKQLASGRLLSRNGDGHTAYTTGDGCIDSAVDAYLVDGTLPPVGKLCQ
jgi:pimeloyl-ACP methyl ester carboxylesterase